MRTCCVPLQRIPRFIFCSLALLIISALIISACAPRGETKTLDEIVKESQQYFAKTLSNAEVAGPLREEVKSLGASISEMLRSDSIQGETCLRLAESIESFIPKSGYTNRPAFTQLERQWRDLAGEDRFARNALEKPRELEFQNSPALRLLVARTLRTFARELETTGFRV